MRIKTNANIVKVIEDDGTAQSINTEGASQEEQDVKTALENLLAKIQAWKDAQ